MASIRLAYVGGGSTRAAGTMAAFVHNHGVRFAGSEVVLIDLVPERLAIVERLASRMARARGLDIRFRSTTDLREGLTDVDAILSSYRPGGFEARILDERIPLKHGVIGQETQGPGGFFMALRSIHVLQGILEVVDQVAPRARIFNYTNPVNIVAQAATMHSDVPFTSFCEGTFDFPKEIAQAAGLDPSRISARMIGLNHTTWSVASDYDGQDAMIAIQRAWEGMRDESGVDLHDRRFVELAVTMGAIPSQYLRYFYFHDEMLEELRAKATTRAEDILSWVPDYWAHYTEQADSDDPVLDPARSRGGIFELELALDAIDSTYNDLGLVLPVNIPNRAGTLVGFPEDLVVEVFARVDAAGIHPEPMPPLPHHVRGLIGLLGEYQ
jgi:6-phospho-beta-glucosidase